MNEPRPTKKQQELLGYIDSFIKENNYGPSYREIMRALDYKSVSTVAVHVDGLIARGFLVKTAHSARTLEVVNQTQQRGEISLHIEWLKSEIQKRVNSSKPNTATEKDILQAALNVLDPKDK